MTESVRFYLDQHIPPAIAQGLRQRGIDAVTTQERGACGKSDVEQLQIATAENRVILTLDSDYLALHRQGIEHAGIAWCPDHKYSLGQIIQILVMLHAVYTAEEMRNRIEYL